MTDEYGRPYPLPDDVNSVDNAPIKHECDASRTHVGDTAGFYGPSISHIVFNDGLWWATAGNEYATAITYCPFCGEKLST